jgi:hypothetical protein
MSKERSSKMNFDTLEETVRNAEVELERVDLEKQKADEKVKKISDELVATCKPVVLDAIGKFNKGRQKGYRIISESVSLSFSVKEKKIACICRFVGASGFEPDEDFDDSGDVEACVGNELRPMVDGALQAAKIPFTLGPIIVPHTYFSK